jgi:hypothetical protein
MSEFKPTRKEWREIRWFALWCEHYAKCVVIAGRHCHNPFARLSSEKSNEAFALSKRIQERDQ